MFFNKLTKGKDANTRRYLDVDLTTFERYGRQMDVKTTLCAYWETPKRQFVKLLFDEMKLLK